jgi:signal transduction histidine kinase
MKEIDSPDLPMRPSLFGRWLNIWHAVYIGGLLVALGISLWDARGNWSWRELALAAIVAVLIVIYLRAIAFSTSWPLPTWFLLGYYALVISLFAVAIYLEPVFLYALGMLFGQMFGVLPPVLVLPGVLAVVGLFIIAGTGWRFPTDITLGGVLFVAVQVAGLFILYLYIYHLIRTSQERARLVAELQAAQEQLQRAKEQEVELAALRERERVARDLHDGLGHSLVTLSMQLEAIQRLYAVDPQRASAQVDAMKQLTRESMTQLRQALDGLRAPGLDGQRLTEALPRYCADFSRETGLPVTIEIDPAADTLRPLAAETLWRIALEALTNVQRHAQATAVGLRLTVAGDRASLVVSDDGIGLPPNAERLPGHYGMRGMRERVEALGGTLTLSGNGDGRGTSIRADIPLPAATAPTG